jgi:hypothetical protein
MQNRRIMNEKLEIDVFYDRVKNCDPPKADNVVYVNCGSLTPPRQKKFISEMNSFDKIPKTQDKETGLKVDTVNGGYVEMDMPVFDRKVTNRENWDDWKDKALREPKKDLEITTLLEKVEEQKDYKKILALAALGVKHQHNTFDVVEKRIGTLQSYCKYIVAQLDRLEQDLEQLKKLAVLNG